jgi:hypothetical protein
MPLAVVESWQAAINARDLTQLTAVTADDIEIVGPRGSGRGRELLQTWITRGGFTAEALRWFCGAHGIVVVEQRGRWHLPDASGPSERIVASAFRVYRGRVVRYQRFDELNQALAAVSLDEQHEVIHCS